MHAHTERSLIEAIKDHPAIVKAAITGSRARRMEDQFSDLDVLLVARNVAAVSDVRAWLPDSVEALVCAFHLTHFCTVLLADFQKIDLAIFSESDPASLWVVHDYKVIKGGEDFAAQLAEAAKMTREQRAAHLGADVSTDNVLLLLITAWQRVGRGELLSAHGFLAMACDMVVALDTRQRGVSAEADLLDPRRRLEQLQPALGAAMQECLFAPPGEGVSRLAQFLATSRREELTGSQGKVLEHLLEPGKAAEAAR